jgi:hypothetical protein
MYLTIQERIQKYNSTVDELKKHLKIENIPFKDFFLKNIYYAGMIIRRNDTNEILGTVSNHKKSLITRINNSRNVIYLKSKKGMRELSENDIDKTTLSVVTNWNPRDILSLVEFFRYKYPELPLFNIAFQQMSPKYLGLPFRVDQRPDLIVGHLKKVNLITSELFFQYSETEELVLKENEVPGATFSIVIPTGNIKLRERRRTKRRNVKKA